MNRPSRTRLDAFETALLTELMSVVGQTASAPARARSFRSSRRHPRRWWAVAAAAVAATLVAVLVVPGLGPAPAYAVTGRNDQQVKVKVNRLEGADGLERALRERGIPADITYLAPKTQCAPHRYAEVRTSGMVLSVSAERFEVTIPAGSVGQGDTFVLSAAVVPLPNGVRASVEFGVAHGPVAACRVVQAP